MQFSRFRFSALSNGLVRHWPWAVTFVCVLAAFLLRDSFGMGWDDAQHAIYGALVLDYFLSGFQDMRWQTDIGGLYNYGTIFDLPSAALHRWLGGSLFTWRPFLMAITGALCIPAVAGIGRRFGGEIAAVFAVAALLLSPQFVGQAFINCKDIPLATAVSWSVLAMLRLFEKPVFSRFAVCGLCFGLALAVRVGGLVVFVFFAAALLYLFARLFLQGKVLDFLDETFRPSWIAGLAVLGLVAWILMAALWPVAHVKPLVGPLDAFRQSSAFPTPYPVLFMGETIPSDKLPWSYLPVMLFLTAPLALAGFAIAGLLGLAFTAIKSWKNLQGLQAFLLVFWIVFPVAYVIWKKPNIYDGVRHFLFLLPAFAVCAGLAGTWLAGLLNRFKAGWGIPVVALLFLSALPAIFSTHPYQYTFYNVFAGPRETVHERFETDYWLTSYREAAKLLNEEQKKAGRPLTVVVGANSLSMPCFAEFAEDSMQMGAVVGKAEDKTIPANGDFWVAVTRYDMHKNFPEAPIFAEIRSGGALMSVIRKSKSPQPTSDPAPAVPAEPTSAATTP